MCNVQTSVDRKIQHSYIFGGEENACQGDISQWTENSLEKSQHKESFAN